MIVVTTKDCIKISDSCKCDDWIPGMGMIGVSLLKGWLLI